MCVFVVDDFLLFEQVFCFVVKQVDSQIVEVRFVIVDGYYMYCECFVVVVDLVIVMLVFFDMLVGKVKFDQMFNKDVEIYWYDVVFCVKVQNVSVFFMLIVML